MSRYFAWAVAVLALLAIHQSAPARDPGGRTAKVETKKTEAEYKALLVKGSQLLAQKKCKEAEGVLRQIDAESQEYYPDSRKLLASARLELKKPREAYLDLVEFLRARPIEKVPPAVLQGWIATDLMRAAKLMQKQKALYDDTYAAWGLAQVLNRSQPLTYVKYRRLTAEMTKQKRFAKLIALNKRLLEILPGQPSILFTLADAQAAAGRLDDALANYDRAAPLDPYAHIGAADALLTAKRKDEAIKRLEEALEKGVADEKARARIGKRLAEIKGTAAPDAKPDDAELRKDRDKKLWPRSEKNK